MSIDDFWKFGSILFEAFWEKFDHFYHSLESFEHSKLDERLNELTKRHFLSKPEQVEQINLKKLKLKIKDRIENIVRQHRSDTVASGK